MDDRDALLDEIIPSIDEEITEDEKNMALLAHLAILGSWVMPLLGLGLILWMHETKAKESWYINKHVKSALNYQLNVLIASIICMFLIPVFLIGIPLLIGLGITTFIFPIIAGVKAQRAEDYEYPFVYRIIQ